MKKLKFTPGIAVVQVGDDPASTIYVDYKQKDCERVHFHSEVYRMSEGAIQEAVIDQIQTFNARKEIQAIRAQMRSSTGRRLKPIILIMSPILLNTMGIASLLMYI